MLMQSHAWAVLIALLGVLISVAANVPQARRSSNLSQQLPGPPSTNPTTAAARPAGYPAARSVLNIAGLAPSGPSLDGNRPPQDPRRRPRPPFLAQQQQQQQQQPAAQPITLPRPSVQQAAVPQNLQHAGAAHLQQSAVPGLQQLSSLPGAFGRAGAPGWQQAPPEGANPQQPAAGTGMASRQQAGAGVYNAGAAVPSSSGGADMLVAAAQQGRQVWLFYAVAKTWYALLRY